MSCDDFQADLVGYHFATLSPDARRALEAHLVDCAGCIRACVHVKRELDGADGDGGPRPSDAARARLRDAVATELGKRPRAWSWWERPLAFTLATAATLLAIVAITQLSTRAASPPHGLADPAAAETRGSR